MDFVIGVVLCAIVVRQFDETLTIKDVLAVRDGLRPIVSKEVNVEFGLRLSQSRPLYEGFRSILWTPRLT